MKRTFRTLFLIPVALFLLSALVGCGGPNGEKKPDTPELKAGRKDKTGD